MTVASRASSMTVIEPSRAPTESLLTRSTSSAEVAERPCLHVLFDMRSPWLSYPDAEPRTDQGSVTRRGLRRRS